MPGMVQRCGCKNLFPVDNYELPVDNYELIDGCIVTEMREIGDVNLVDVGVDDRLEHVDGIASNHRVRALLRRIAPCVFGHLDGVERASLGSVYAAG